MRFILPGSNWKWKGQSLPSRGVRSRGGTRFAAGLAAGAAVATLCRHRAGPAVGPPNHTLNSVPSTSSTYLLMFPCPSFKVVFLQTAAGWQLQIFWNYSLCRYERV